MLRPLSSIDLPFNIDLPNCCAQDVPGIECEETPVGHLWPSDFAMLDHISQIKASRKQSFPYLQKNHIADAVCQRHAELFSLALDSIQSPTKVS